MNDPDLAVDRLERLVVTHSDWDNTYGAYALLVSCSSDMLTLKPRPMSRSNTGIGRARSRTAMSRQQMQNLSPFSSLSHGKMVTSSWLTTTTFRLSISGLTRRESLLSPRAGIVDQAGWRSS